MTGKWHGSAPTRDEVIAEIARELSMRRHLVNSGAAGNVPQAYERIDRLQAGYDWLMEHWPREQREIGL